MRDAISAVAQGVLDVRATEVGASLADLYNPPMPAALQKAHRKLDAADTQGGGKRSWKSDAARVAHLFTLYQKLTSL